MREGYTIHQSLDEATVTKAASKLLWKKKLLIAVLAAVTFFSLNSYILGFYSNESVFSGSNFFMLSVTIILIVAIFRAINNKVKEDYRKNNRFYTDVTFTFSKSGIFATGKGFQNETPWSYYKKIEETKNWFLIYRSDIHAQIIDKKQITDFSTDELRSFFKSVDDQIKVVLI